MDGGNWVRNGVSRVYVKKQCGEDGGRELAERSGMGLRVEGKWHLSDELKPHFIRNSQKSEWVNTVKTSSNGRYGT